MKSNQKTILAFGIVISFALLISSIALYFNYQHDQMQSSRLSINDIDNMTIQQIKDYIQEKRNDEMSFHAFYLIPFIGFIGLIIGLLVYYIMEEKIISKDKSLKKNTKIILNFLSPHERAVINKLLENNGSLPQYELSYLPNLNKVKTHRILSNLENKKIIYKEKLGKINKIILNKDLYEVLKDNF